MNIIFIHGMNQQHETAQSIEKRWLSLLEQALNQTQQEAAFTYLKRHFRMPFYGDLLSRYHLSNVLSASTLLPQTWPHLPFLHLNTHAQKKPNTATSTIKTPLQPIIQPKQPQPNFHTKFHQFSALSKDYALHHFALWMNDFPKLHTTLLHKFLVETDLYLSNSHFMHAVHLRIHQQLHDSKPNIIVAHSLGSVIAYHYLLEHPEMNIRSLITLGCPLAFQTIQKRLPQPIQRPTSLKGDWINFYSHDDFLAALALQKSPFDFSSSILNREILTSIEHPHDIAGYLQHPEVIHAILNSIKN